MLIEGANRNTFLDKKDLQDGEFIQIADAGWVEESKKYTNQDGSPKVRRMFNVIRMGAKFTAEFNWTSVKELCSMYGSETADWVGKWVRVSKVFDPAKKLTMFYFMPVDKSKNEELNKTAKPLPAAEAKTDAPKTADEIAWED